MLTYEEALKNVLQSVNTLPPVELPLLEAAGLVLAAPAVARWDMPRSNNSAMDGYAVASQSTARSAKLEIIGEAYAGHPFSGTLAADQAIRITTGAPLPKGAVAVIPLEEADEQDNYLVPRTVAETGQHIRCQGEEFRNGEALLNEGTLLRFSEIALLVSAGVERVSVFPRPKVAIISTGDELVPFGQEPQYGQIVNSNLHLLTARLKELNCDPVSMGIGRDEPALLDSLFATAQDADLIISTGGVSVGAKDHVMNVLENRGFQKIFWKVAIKPGKPVLFGLLGGKPLFGLPGNPAATAATFELFVRPALCRLAGLPNFIPRKRQGQLTASVKGASDRQAFLWCHIEWQDEHYVIHVPERQGSGQIRCLRNVNALLPVPAGVNTLAAGELADVILIA